MAQAIETYHLQDCCKQALYNIAEIQEIGRILQSALATSPFALLVVSHLTESLVTFVLVPTDWDQWGEAVQRVPGIVKDRCRQIAFFKILNHKGGPLNKFWNKMYASFR